MRIFIVRHGIAEDSAAGGDAVRELTEEGRKKMREAASGFVKLNAEADLICSSPLVRAVQTAEIIAKELDYSGEVEIMRELSPGANPLEALEKLRKFRKVERVVLAGHEPNCSELAGYLLGDARLEFKKGAICLIESASCTKGSGTLIWHLSPQALRLVKGNTKS